MKVSKPSGEKLFVAQSGMIAEISDNGEYVLLQEIGGTHMILHVFGPWQAFVDLVNEVNTEIQNAIAK